MLSRALAARDFRAEKGFRWRGQDVSRFEGVSDAVFAFSVTLLVVSLEVPKTFDELLEAMRGFLAFGLSFATLAWIWFSHYRFFRRFGLHDGVTLLLGGTLLFVVLFYVYPLKFLTSTSVTLLGELFGRTTGESVIQAEQVPQLMAIYGLGFAAVFGLFALLYRHAYRQRQALELTATEQLATRHEVASNVVHVSLGLLCVLVALLGGPLAVWAGMAFVLEWPVQTLVGRHFDRLERQAAVQA